MTLQELQGLDPAAVALIGVILGLCVGSFLNVVIYRVPARIHQEWTSQCRSWLDIDDPEVRPEDGESADSTTVPEQEPVPGIVRAPSHCPACKCRIKPWHNIPVVSYLLLRGKCSSCGEKISPRYPLVEILTAVLTTLVFMEFGLTPAGACVAGFTWTLVALSFIDLDHQILPDNITLPLLWAGLFLSLYNVFVDPVTAIIGALAGYLVLWSVYHLFRLVTGKEGMGYGDFKLLAAMGAWMGWQLLPLIIMLSAIAGTLVGLLLMMLRGHSREKPIPYGPWLAIAGWIAMMWGEEITGQYLRASGLL